MGFVYLSELKNYCSVPYRFIGYPVVLEYNQSTIEIYYNKERIAIHNISLRKGFYTSTPEHLSSSHKFYQEWSPDFFIKKALKIGENTTRYIEKLISQQEYPEIGYKQAMGILSLQKMYSVLRLKNACKKGFEYNYCNYRTIKNILENNMDKLLDNHDPKPTVPNHENIRGAQAYC